MIDLLHKLYHDYEVIADIIKAIASMLTTVFGAVGIIDSIAGTTYKVKITSYAKNIIKSVFSRKRPNGRNKPTR